MIQYELSKKLKFDYKPESVRENETYNNKILRYKGMQ